MPDDPIPLEVAGRQAARGDGAMRVSRWAAAQMEAGGWVRRMFAEGQRLRALHGHDAVADLALGQPLGDPSDAVRAAMEAAARERFPGRSAYMPNLGYPEVRERAARDVGVDGVTAEHVVMTGGAGAAIVLALRALVDEGDEVVIVRPYFGEYSAYCAAVGATPVTVDADAGRGFALDLDAVERALSDRTAVLILNTPCNPTGHVVDADEMSALAAVLERHAARTGRRVALLVDEVYRRLVYGPAVRAEPFAVYPFTLLARSFSKDLGLAGERIGYLAVHPQAATVEMMRALELCQRALGFVNAPATMQRMLLHLEWWEPDLHPHRARRDHAAVRLRDAGLDVAEPQGGLYLWARAPWEDGLAFVSALAERRVLVAPGIAFGMPQWLRVCFTAPEPAVEALHDAIAEVCELGLPA